MSGASAATCVPTIPNRVVWILLMILDTLCAAFPDVCETALFVASYVTVGSTGTSCTVSDSCIGDEAEVSDKASAMDRNDG